MAVNTQNLQLIKAEQEDYIDETLVDNFGANWDILDTEVAKKINNVSGVPSFQAGLDSNKPVAGTPGRIYIATDTRIIYRDTGASWVKIGVAKWEDIENKPSSFTPSAHETTHRPGGSDALPTAAPSGGLGTSNSVGTSTSFARADHVHLAFDSTAPANVSTTASAGSATVAARRDHVHALVDNVVTDAKIGNRTINDGSAPTGDTGTLTTLLGWLGNMIKSITGKANWRTAPAITLEALSAHKSRHATGGADALTPADIGAETPAGAQAKADAAAGAVQDELEAHKLDYVPHFGFSFDTSLTYNANSNLIQVDEKEGTTLKTRTTLAYDSGGNLIAVTVKKYEGANVILEYTDTLIYDVDGKLEAVERRVG